MIPILYEKDETAFISNGLGRLRDCITCTVTEERNGIYELDFEYPITGQNYDKIQIGRIVAVEHDDSGDIQPFDIVSYSKPIEGIVTFHCVHISYRQSHLTVRGTGINSLAAAFTLLKDNAIPANPFLYWTDKVSTGYLGAADGIPKSVRSMLGGVEGSILDAYGGEYEWDRFTVKLWQARGEYKDFTIRYGVNMTSYNDDTDASECFCSCIPYWTDGTATVVGDKQTLPNYPPSGRDECVPLDVSEKFESQPTKAQVQQAGLAMLMSANPYLPAQNITVSFIRLQDSPEYEQFSSLLSCRLCDSIKVIFPDYNSSGNFKIVKTVWDVLGERYIEMELGSLSVSLSEALGVGQTQVSAGGGGGGVLEFYPVGSYYETSKSQAEFDPNIAWGGTWQLETEGQVHISSGTNYNISGALTNTSDGGEKTHTLNINEIPSHEGHLARNSGSYTGYGNATSRYLKQETLATYGSQGRGWNVNGGEITPYGMSRGGGTAHNNMPPYIVVNRWHRIA